MTLESNLHILFMPPSSTAFKRRGFGSNDRYSEIREFVLFAYSFGKVLKSEFHILIQHIFVTVYCCTPQQQRAGA